MNPSGKKLRGGGNSALTKLKALCVREFEKDGASAALDQIMLWAADEKNTNAIIRQRLGEFYKIQLARDSQLSSFYSWVKLTRKTHEREAKIQHWLECEKLEHPELPDAELFRRGQRKFQLISIAEEDPESWVKIQREQRGFEQLALDRDKLELLSAEKMLDARLRQVADELNASALSQADKIAAMRKAAFKDVEAFEASGKLKLPKP